jgi:hypothetical protein
MELLNTLSLKHAHPRDSQILFDEPTHTYTIDVVGEGGGEPIPGTKYISVTSLVHTLFPRFDADRIIKGMMSSPKWKPGHAYWGKTMEEIKADWEANRVDASTRGTKLHYAIECFLNQSIGDTHADLLSRPSDGDDDPEWNYFLQFVRDTPAMIPYRTEWRVFDETLGIAGSIDMVYKDPDTGALSIYDWKRAKEISAENPFRKFGVAPETREIPDTNYWHYALQLNIYKRLLERRYLEEGQLIQDLVLIRLHPNADTYERIMLPDLTDTVDRLFARITKNKA